MHYERWNSTSLIPHTCGGLAYSQWGLAVNRKTNERFTVGYRDELKNGQYAKMKTVANYSEI